MRNSSVIIIAGLIFILLTDGLLWYQLRLYFRRSWMIIAYWLHTGIFIAAFLVYHFSIARLQDPEAYFWIEKFIGVLFLFYIPKIIFLFFNGIGRLFKNSFPRMTKTFRFSSGILAGTLFLFLLYGITIGRYHYKTETVEVPLTGLPAAFEHFRIIQLSDLHLGSFGKSYKGLNKLVDEVNGLHPDLIVFTGDMVNNFAAEMPVWIPVMQKLQARYGKYAVTGNHDYGDYTHWLDHRAKVENLHLFFKYMQEMGFHMLNNTAVPLVSGQDTLWLAGVENWGKPPFPQYGDLSAALRSIPAGKPIILLSHDPSHWRSEILNHQIPLTLSGHTHAMQLGIKIGNIRWSPAQYIYPEYDGLYREDHYFLHVNRGQGYIGYPGRAGLRPVITEIILVRAKQ